ncbi:MAG: tRNA 4-thiouridine(8) synthase ThiI, partial [Oscillospiraceae bacterium]
ERAKLKVLKLCQKLIPYTGRIKVHIVNFTEIQDEIAKNCEEEYFTLIMRRFMMEIASIISESSECGALITGESLGQVASQTMQAIECTDSASKQLVMRPLIGMDKNEIVEIAAKIDTFDTSILPYEDCCTVFTPRHPRTKPHLSFILSQEEKLPRQALIEKAVETAETIMIDEKFEL